MEVSTSCRHTHHVTIQLGESEGWIEPGYTDRLGRKVGKDILVTNVGAQWIVEEGRVSSVNLTGWYAKKDGTASQTRVAYPVRSTMEALLPVLQDRILMALDGLTHG